MAATRPLTTKDLIHKYGWDILPYLSNLGVKNLAEAQLLFVDSGATNALDADDGYHGHSFETPLATIDYAIGLCTADEGAVILVAPGHNESLAAATIDFDVAGVTCIGIGEGTLRPRIDFDNAASSIDIGANNVTLINLTFLPSITDVLIGVDVEANKTNFKMIDCEFLEGEDGSDADEFIVCVDLKSANSDTLIKKNVFRSQSGSTGCTTGIMLTAASSRVRIEDNVAVGNFSTAFIDDGAACPNIYIVGNTIKVKDGEPGIELTATTTGIIADNKIESTGLAVDAMIVAADCSWFNNYGVTADGTAAELIGGGEVTAAIEAYNLDHLALTTTGVNGDGDLSSFVVDKTILAHIMAVDADTSDYDASKHSLEAIGEDADEILEIFMGYNMRSIPGSAMPIAVWFVDSNISESGDGTTPAAAFKTLTEAITACSNATDDWVFVFDYSGGEESTITINKKFIHIIGNACKGMPYPRIKPTGAYDGITFTDAADRVEIANMTIGAGDQTKSAISFAGCAAGAYGNYIHDCVIGRDADAPCLYGIYVPSGAGAPYLVVENNRFIGSAGAGIAALGSAIRIAGNATRCTIEGNRILDVGRTATPAIWLDGSVVEPTIIGNHIKHDTDTGTGGAITLGASVDDGWICGNFACDGKDAPAQNPFVDGGSTNGWSQNYSGIVAVLPA